MVITALNAPDKNFAEGFVEGFIEKSNCLYPESP